MKNPVELFNEAERFLRKNGFAREIEWCDNRPPLDEMNDRELLREYAWVVFNSGMSNAVIEAKWREITKAFRYFNPSKIMESSDEVLRDVLKVFGNHKKAEAIIQTTRLIFEEGSALRRKIKEDPLKTLDTLPFIGNITKFHLARNLGFGFIKPDRHLVRLAKKFNMTAFELCDVIHEKTGRRLGTIDIVLWRYCEQRGQTRF